MREAVAELNDAIARLLVRPDRQLELAADFAGLFLVDPKQGALPYESLYRGEAKLLMQAPMTEMQARLDRLGINVSDKYKEPADHLAIELDLMGNLIIRAAEAKSARAGTLARRAGSAAARPPAGVVRQVRKRLSRCRPVWLLWRQCTLAWIVSQNGYQLLG